MKRNDGITEIEEQHGRNDEKEEKDRETDRRKGTETKQRKREREKSERNVPFIRSAGQRSVPDPRNVNYIEFVYGH